MSFLKKCGIWIKKNWKLVAATLATIGLILSFYFFREDRKEKEILKRKLEISKKKKEIIKLETQKKMISESRKDNKEDIKTIDSKLEAIEKDINKRRAEVAKITLNQRLEELDKMGY